MSISSRGYGKPGFIHGNALMADGGARALRIIGRHAENGAGARRRVCGRRYDDGGSWKRSWSGLAKAESQPASAAGEASAT